MERSEILAYDDAYWKLMDAQIAPYEVYARKHGLTDKEMFVLEVVWQSPEGCQQNYICERLSATKQTVSAIVKKFCKLGYMTLTTSEADRRGKVVRFTETGLDYAQKLLTPVLDAKVDALAGLQREEIEELIRLTALFSRRMQKNYTRLLED